MEQEQRKISPFKFELPFFKPTEAFRLSGKPDNVQHFVVFLEVARTLPGMVRVIPKAGGQKYSWEKKVPFHLDLEDLAQLAVYLLDLTPTEPFTLYRKGPDQKEKTLKIAKGLNKQYVVKTTLNNEEIVLTLLSPIFFY
jgi:hypothetical protein